MHKSFKDGGMIDISSSINCHRKSNLVPFEPEKHDLFIYDVSSSLNFVLKMGFGYLLDSNYVFGVFNPSALKEMNLRI